MAAGEGVEVVEDGRDGESEGERGQRQIYAGQPERGDADQEPAHPSQETGRWDGRPVRDACAVDKDRSRVAADRHEGSVAQGDLAAVPSQDVEAEQSDDEDGDLGELERIELVGDRGQADQDHASDHYQPHDLRTDRGQPPHTRLTAARPNSPAGRTSSTTTITISPKASRRSCPPGM